MLGDQTNRSHIATRDPVTGNAIIVCDHETTVWSSAAQWSGVVVELHRFLHLDTPEFYVPEHVVVLHRTPAAVVEIKGSDGYRRHCVQRGHVSLFPGGTPRQVRHGASELLIVALSPDLVRQAGHTNPAAGALELEELHMLEDPQIERIANALEAEAGTGYQSGRVYGESMATALAAHLASRYASGRGRTLEHTGGLSPCRLRRVLGYIDENLAEDVCLDSLARIAGLSQHRFAHNFKRATGLPPHQFVIRRRIERAKPLLRDTNETIATVTYALGFGSPSRFTYLFRRETGVTPSRYRKSFR
jgi:AraC family transcriptional regulator